MMKIVATVTSKGQVTVPKSVREMLGIVKGDVLEFELKAGHVEVRPSRPLRRSAGALNGFLPAGWRAPSVAAMERGIGQALRRRAGVR